MQVPGSPVGSVGVEDPLKSAVERARRGDRKAFGEIYEALAPKVYSYFYYHLSGQSAAAEDLAEDVFLNVLRRLDSFNERGLPFSAWVFRVAHNRLIDYYRAQQRRNHLPLEDAGQTSDGTPERELRRILHRQLLSGALDQLTPDQRNVIVLRFLQHLSPRETALALGKSEDRVKKLQERGLDCLRRLLQPARESALV